MFHFEESNLVRSEEIGRGSFGTVFPYKVDGKDNLWVVKEQMPKAIEHVPLIMQEMVLGFTLEHPNILPLNGFFIKVDNKQADFAKKLKFYLKSERMACDLQTKISHTQSLIPKEQVIKYLYSLASALVYLHKKRIAHRDIKPANVLVDHQGNLKLTDIGAAKFIAQGETMLGVSKLGGTPLYMAPECRDSSQKNADLYKADIWSLGILMIDICLRSPQRVSFDRDLNIINGIIEENLRKIEADYDKGLAGLIRQLVSFNHSDRPSAEEICESLENSYPEILGIQKKLSKSAKKEKDDNLSECRIASLTDRVFDSCMDDLVETLKEYNVKNLKEFSLNFQHYTQIKDKQMEKINQITKNIDSLQKLALNFKKSIQISDNGFTGSVTCFTSKFKNITDLSLNFESGDITDEGLGLLGESLSRLEKLSLDFSKCTQISDEGIKAFIQNADKKLNQLKELSLNLLDCDRVTEAGRSTLIQYIATSLNKLEDLELLLHWKESEGPEIMKMSSALCEIQRLKSLSLNFDWSGLSHNTTKELRENLSRLKKLQKLSLSFESCIEFDDLALKEICSVLSTDFTNIKQLSLNFDGCYKIKTFSPLYAAIDSLQNLKELSLNLANLDMMNNDNDEQLKNLGKSLKNLLKLSLDFSGCEKLKTSDIKALFDNIGESLRNLQDLSINMKNCTQVNDETASEIAKYISTKFLNLQELCLDLSDNQLNNAGVEEILSIYKNLKNLVKLALIFEGCGEIDKDILITLIGFNEAHLQKLQHMILDFRRYNVSLFSNLLSRCSSLMLEDKYKFMQALSYLPQIDIL